MGTGLDNPFAWLGIPVGASVRDLRRRLDELTVQADLGLAPAYVNRDRLTEVRRILEDVRGRQRAQFLWMLAPSVLGYTPDVVTSHEQLVAQINQLGSLPRRPELASKHILAHDLGVLEWAAFTENPGDFTHLAQALRYLDSAIDDDAFWKQFQVVCVDAADPRAMAELSALRTGSRGLLVDSIVETVRATRGHAGDIKQAIQVVRDSKWPAIDVQRVTQALLGSLVARAKDALESFTDAVGELNDLEQFDDLDFEEEDGLCQSTRTVNRRLRDEWLPAFQAVQAIDPEAMPSRLADGFARTLLVLSPKTWPSCNMGPLGMRLFQIAIESGRTPTVLSRVRALESEARTAFHTHEMYEAKDRGAWPTAAAHAHFLIRFGPEDQRTHFREVEHVLTSRSGPNGQRLAADARALIETEISRSLDALGRPQAAIQATSDIPQEPAAQGEPAGRPMYRQLPLEWANTDEVFRRTLVKRALGAAFGGALILRILGALQGNDSEKTRMAFQPSLSTTTKPAEQVTPTAKPKPTSTPARIPTAAMLPWEYRQDFERAQKISVSNPDIATATIENGVLRMIVKQPGWSYGISFPDLPENADYEINAIVSLVSGAGSIGLGLAAPSNETIWVYDATPGESLWSVYLDGKSNQTKLFEVDPRYTSSLKYRRLTELSLAMVDRVPIFRINGINVATADHQRIPLPAVNGPRYAVVQIEAPPYPRVGDMPLTVEFETVSVRAI